MVKCADRRNLIGVWMGAIVIAFGCADDPSMPIAPTPVSSPAAQGPMSSPDLLAMAATDRSLVGQTPDLSVDNMVGLKATAPTPVAPIDDVEVAEAAPLLTVSNATGLYVDADFQHEFRLSKVTGGNEMEIERGSGTPAGPGTTSYRVQAALDAGASYTWRARPVFEGVYGPWSENAGFRTVGVTLGVPQPRAPIDGATTTTLRPLFNVGNGTVKGTTGTVNIQIQVATDSSFMGDSVEAETHARDRGDTNLQLADELTPATEYFWRARARLQSDPGIASGWSAPERFFTPDPSTAAPTTAPGRGNCCPPPNRFDIVQAVLGRTGDLYRRNVQEFTQRVAECLAVTDGDWGRRRNDSGAIGKDTVAYRTSRGPGRGPFSIDIMLGATSSNPQPHWSIQRHDGVDGRVGGTWIEVDGSNCILGNVK